MFTVAQIQQAHSKVKSGADFPKYIQEIKQLGVTAFTTYVSDSHTDYFGNNYFQTSSDAKYSNLAIAEKCNKEAFVEYLKSHQKGATDYFLFCKHCAETGIDKWVMDLHKMTCMYFDKNNNEILVEKISQ